MSTQKIEVPTTRAGWVEVLAASEYVPLNETARAILSVTDDDSSSAKHLNEVICRDAGLSAQIIKLANSVAFNTSKISISTVFQGILRLGFNEIKRMALSVSLYDHISKASDAPILLSALARALAVGSFSRQVARMQNNKRMAEAMYVAGLLANIGEIVFLAHPASSKTDYGQVLKSTGHPELAAKQTLGISFSMLARELLKRWNIKGLIMDVHQSQSTLPEVNSIRFAQKLSSQYFSNPKGCKPLLQNLAKHCELTPEEVENSVAEAAEEMVQQAEAIGFKQFERYLPQQQVEPVAKGNEQKLMEVMLQFNKLSQGPVDINELFRIAAQGTYDAIAVERVAVCILNPKAKRLESRYVHGEKDLHIAVSVSQVDQRGLQFSRWLAQQSGAVLLSTDKQPEPIAAAAKGDCLIAPLRISSTLVGMMYADAQGDPISSEVFNKFSLLANQVIALLATGNIKV